MSDRYTDREEYDPSEYIATPEAQKYDYQDPIDYGAGGVSMSSGDLPGFVLFILGIILYPTVLDYFLTGACWLLRKMRLPLLTAYKIYFLVGLSPTIGVIWLLSSGPRGHIAPAVGFGLFVLMLSGGSIRSNEHKLAPDYK